MVHDPEHAEHCSMRHVICSISILSPYLHPRMPTTLPTMGSKLHTKTVIHADNLSFIHTCWQPLIHSSFPHTRSLSHDSLSQTERSTCSGCHQSRLLQCVLQCVLQKWAMESCDVSPLASHPAPLLSLPLMLSPLTENAFVSIFCEFAKLKRDAAVQPPSACPHCTLCTRQDFWAV